ncbi:MAG: hypothetical protein ABIQ02_04350 [Saprospiraceae bacterium]
MTLHTTIYWVLLSAIWYFANGALHDFFIVRNHKGKYDRDLLRLLMDGHVLMLSGAILFITFIMLRHDIPYAGWINIIVALGMLIYCAMIFPFLKSIMTIIISLILLIVSLVYALQ